MINQEDIYQFLQKENWKALIDIFYSKKSVIKNDILLQQSLETTLNVITHKAINYEDNPEFIESLESVLLLHFGNWIVLNTSQQEAITLAIINSKKENLSYCYPYAKKYPDNEICKEIIALFEKDLPKETIHSQFNKLTVTENNSIVEKTNLRKSLFNSLQETEFFLALKRTFPTYQIYPNVALSSVISFELIKQSLSKNEQDFFLKSSVDFVVFEPFNNYYPIYFFEIDSVWHDSEEQKGKDKIKDKIFSISGLKLFRIRKKYNTVDEKEFQDLLIEIRTKIDNASI